MLLTIKYMAVVLLFNTSARGGINLCSKISKSTIVKAFLATTCMHKILHICLSYRANFFPLTKVTVWFWLLMEGVILRENVPNTVRTL